MIRQVKAKTFLTGLIFFTSLLVFYFFFNHWLLYPLRMLVVFLHESSHAIAGFITGATILEFEMHPNEGGHVVMQGGINWITAMSGYIGSLAWGLFLLYFSSKTKNDKWAFLLLSIWFAFFTLFYFSNIYTLVFGLFTAVVFLLIFMLNNHTLCDISLKAIGLFSIAYVPLDIFSDTISRSHLKSDAFTISQELGLTTIIWGWIWLAISVVVIFYGLLWTLRSINESNLKEYSIEK